VIVEVKLSALKNTKGYEYALRFVLGGLATVFTGLIASLYGPITGGLFLAFPAIFCASVTLVEKHERERKQKLGLRGTRRGQEAAAQEAAGTALGSFGLIAFGGVIWLVLPTAGTIWSFAFAIAAWSLVSTSLWWFRRYLRFHGATPESR
jgi:Protein of unknown function (DUF3147)